MTLTSKCPSCGHTHIVRPAIGQGAHGAGVVVLEHEQLALQGAELFALRSFKASVPWPSICDLLWAIDDREPGAMALKLWYDANHPQEATE